MNAFSATEWPFLNQSICVPLEKREMFISAATLHITLRSLAKFNADSHSILKSFVRELRRFLGKQEELLS